MSGLSLVDVYSRIRRACAAAGSQKQWAEQHGLSQAYVSDVLNARTDPGPAILKAIGLRKVVRYVEARAQ